MDFTRLTYDEIIEKLKRENDEFEKNLEREKEQKRKEIEGWENFLKENKYNDNEIGLAYKKDLPEGKYIFIFLIFLNFFKVV
jgi:phage terminase large subunit-like protein